MRNAFFNDRRDRRRSAARGCARAHPAQLPTAADEAADGGGLDGEVPRDDDDDLADDDVLVFDEMRNNTLALDVPPLLSPFFM